MIEKSDQALRTIGELADMLGVETHVLRYWETQFPQLLPVKHKNGRRYYRPQDVALVTLIQTLLYQRGFTIKGAKAYLEEQAASQSLPVAKKPSKIPDDALLHEGRSREIPAQTEKNALQEGLSALHRDLLQLQEKVKSALS